MYEKVVRVSRAVQQPSFDLLTCFNDLLLSSAYRPSSASIMTKWDILMRFWEKEVPYLQGRFRSDGSELARPDFSGFGFVVEGLAHFSFKLPRNTNRGDVTSQLIVAALHEGGSDFIQLNGRQANSDFIWLDYVGRRVTVHGIGEVKASYEAFRERRWQPGRQEIALRQLAKKLEAGKATNDFFRKRKLVIPEEYKRMLIVPFGEGIKFKNDVPKGWKLVELEFSYEEIVFIAKRIWPEFRLETKFGPGRLTELELITIKLVDGLKPKIDEIFLEFRGQIPYRQLGLFILTVGKLAGNKEEMDWIEGVVESCYWPALQDCLDKPLVRENLTQQEEVLYTKLLYALTSDQNLLLLFLNFVRHLSCEIINKVRKDHQVRHLQALQSLGFLEIW